MIEIDSEVRALAERVIAGGQPKRAILALKVLLEKGEVSTDELQDLGYNHPPRIIGDIRDAGVPITTGSGTSRSGNRMAVYRFGSRDDIQDGRIGGRSALPKAFKAALIARYGAIDCITGAKLDERVLQMDHRIPYRIAGDEGLADHDVEAFMLLDGSSQRAKSFSCENCENMTRRDPDICRRCYWAYPDDYDHVAMAQIRRLDVVFQGGDVAAYDKLKAIAERAGRSVNDLVKELARHKSKEA